MRQHCPNAFSFIGGFWRGSYPKEDRDEAFCDKPMDWNGTVKTCRNKLFKLEHPEFFFSILGRLQFGCCKKYFLLPAKLKEFITKIESPSRRIGIFPETMVWETYKQFCDKYAELKKNIIEFTNAHKKSDRDTDSSEYDQKLETLKIRFGKDIRSVRRLDAAKDIQTLMTLLEKRLVLGWFDVDPLIEIIKTFEMEGSSTFNDVTYYRTEIHHFMVKNEKAFLSPPYDPDVFCEVPSNREVIPADISAWICKRMESDWIKFGEELINADLAVEGQVDELIRDTTLTDEEKTRKLLDILVKGDKRSKRSQLSKILKSMLRNDLAEEVERMFLEGCI